MGSGRSRGLRLTGGGRAAAWGERGGLVNRVVPSGEVLAAAMAMANEVAANQPAAVQMTKRLLNRVEESAVDAALAAETAAALEAFANPAVVSGLKAELGRWAARKRT